MNHDPSSPFASDEAAEREWLAQERASADERAGYPPTADARLRAYRLVARAAGQPPPMLLPADFARRMADRVVAPDTGADAPFERNLLAGLGTVLGAGGGVAMAAFAPAWLPAFGAMAAALGSPWPWALAACLGVSGVCARWLRGPLLHA